MKKFAGITAAGLGLMAAGFAAPSQAAAPTTHISGNFQYTSMQYYCDEGTPNFVFAYRTLNKTEAKVTFSASGYRDYVDTDVSPYTASGTITSLEPSPGAAITVHGVGSTTGSSFNVSGRIPTSCKGLPNSATDIDWASQGKPTAQPVPSTTKPAPTKTTPAPSKSSTSAPTKSTPAPTKSTPAPVKTTTAPATSMPTAPVTSGKGPKVDTDRVSTNNDTALYAMAAGAGAIALAGAGTVAARRRK